MASVRLPHFGYALGIVEMPGTQADGTHGRAAALEDASVGAFTRLVRQPARLL